MTRLCRFINKKTSFSEHLIEMASKSVEEIRDKGNSVSNRICSSAIMDTLSSVNKGHGDFGE
jgi:hypothetical protein